MANNELQPTRYRSRLSLSLQLVAVKRGSWLSLGIMTKKEISRTYREIVLSSMDINAPIGELALWPYRWCLQYQRKQHQEVTVVSETVN